MVVTALLLAASVSTYCTGEAEFAEQVMKYRQKGHPVSLVMRAEDREETRQLIVVLAYKQPVRDSEVGKMEAKYEFSDTIYDMCMRGTK
ncbi:hypothetical protein D3C77_28710 [compost metagenome]